MNQTTETNFADPIAVVQFLKKVEPFNELGISVLRKLAGKTILDFFPGGSKILEQEVSNVEHLYFIQRGGVRIESVDPVDGRTLKDMREEAEYFGTLSIISGGKSVFDVTAVEDTFCYMLERDTFMELDRKSVV